MQIGNSRSRSPGMTSLASSASRARIQFRLPLTVLISPLWAIIRNGWASSQAGKVLVENRECTTTRALAIRSSSSSGKTSSQLLRWSACPCRPGSGPTATRSRPRSRAGLGGAGSRPAGPARCPQGCAPGRHEQLLEVGHVGPGQVAQRSSRRSAPGASRARVRSLLGGDLLDAGLGLGGRSGSVGRKALPTAYAPCRGSRKSTSPRRKASGICSSMPAPSPVLGSEPVAPRWSRLRSASRPWRTIVVAGHAGQRRDECDTAGVVFERGIVEALWPGGPSKGREQLSWNKLPSSSHSRVGAPATVTARARLGARCALHELAGRRWPRV